MVQILGQWTLLKGEAFPFVIYHLLWLIDLSVHVRVAAASLVLYEHACEVDNQLDSRQERVIHK